LKEFNIPFKGLGLGTHQYEWEIGKKFFDAIENPDILNCDLIVKMELDRQERMMVLGFRITGEIETECDRCLGQLILPADIHQNYIIKFGHEHIEESEEVLVISESEYQIDVSGLIFDYVSLYLPIKKVHGDDENGDTLCEGEVLSRLNEIAKNEEVDPRWEALKNIKLDNKQ
jgi:uncharacterized metal-binding protein YceD (DUF177 family)